MIKHLHLLVESTFFRQIADPMQVFSMKRFPEHPNLAGIGSGNADHHANGAGLSGAVWPQQPEDGAFLNAEGKIIHGHKFAVSLSRFIQFDCVHVEKFLPVEYTGVGTSGYTISRYWSIQLRTWERTGSPGSRRKP